MYVCIGETEQRQRWRLALLIFLIIFQLTPIPAPCDTWLPYLPLMSSRYHYVLPVNPSSPLFFFLNLNGFLLLATIFSLKWGRVDKLVNKWSGFSKRTKKIFHRGKLLAEAEIRKAGTPERKIWFWDTRCGTKDKACIVYHPSEVRNQLRRKLRGACWRPPGLGGQRGTLKFLKIEARTGGVLND